MDTMETIIKDWKVYVEEHNVVEPSSRNIQSQTTQHLASILHLEP